MEVDRRPSYLAAIDGSVILISALILDLYSIIIYR